jgi:hypothetical protein
MSASKKRNINRPKQCRGCKNNTKLKYKCDLRIMECKYTIPGKMNIKNCPCSTCLVKPMCTAPCPTLMWNPDFSFSESVSH